MDSAVMLRFPNALGVIFDAGMTQIAWRARMVGSARCADRTPQRGVPTVVLTRIDFERLTNDVISSEAKHLSFLDVTGARNDQRFFAALRMTLRS
jgi:hypothetical protein